ncbi:Uncharacterised protein [Streptococcus pneumoniae]|nr:Uncharacterised protein [Streptococcus pneumoniae]
MNIKALIKKYEELWNEHSPFYEPVPYTSMVELFLKELKQLDELKPVKVPQFVADVIEGAREQSVELEDAFEPFDIGYRIVNKYGQALALRNGASIFDLPFLAEKAIEKEFGKNDPDFDIGKHSVEEVAIVNLSKFHSYFE